VRTQTGSDNGRYLKLNRFFGGQGGPNGRAFVVQNNQFYRSSEHAALAVEFLDCQFNHFDIGSILYRRDTSFGEYGSDFNRLGGHGRKRPQSCQPQNTQENQFFHDALLYLYVLNRL
jgi:hypothetical protein